MLGLASICLALWACDPPEPVLTGLPAEPLLAAKADADEQAAPAYAKSPGIHVDVRHLGGQRLDEVRGLLADQLGPLQATSELNRGDGREMRFSGGVLRVVDGRIYMLRVPLPEPMRRTDALEVLGFPPYVGRYLLLHREYRLNHEWGFRRLRMTRLARDSELVTEVEAWRFIPQEHRG
jgi:hypothetical protein